MTTIFIRFAFLAALAMLVAGALVVRAMVAPYFDASSSAPLPPIAIVAASPIPQPAPVHHRTPPTSTVRPPTKRRPVARVTASPTSQPTASPTPRPAASPTATLWPTATLIPTLIPTPLPTLTPTPRPVPSPTAGMVALARYWVGTPDARRGGIVTIGYVIDNTTGHTEHLLLGASVKSSSTPSWLSSVDDPAHDVVATVPPGVSTHIRYFTLPSVLPPGSYDVAWGLRDAGTGARAGLVFAPGALAVRR